MEGGDGAFDGLSTLASQIGICGVVHDGWAHAGHRCSLTTSTVLSWGQYFVEKGEVCCGIVEQAVVVVVDW